MLVLSRKLGEKIVIGNGIKIEIVEIRQNAVKLGIVADKKVPIKVGEKKSTS